MLGIEARFAREHRGSENLKVTYLRFEPGVRSPIAHGRGVSDEAYIVIGGSGTIELNDKGHRISRLDVIRVNASPVPVLQTLPDDLEITAAGSDQSAGGDTLSWAGTASEGGDACPERAPHRRRLVGD